MKDALRTELVRWRAKAYDQRIPREASKMESSAGCLGVGFAKGGANSWALDLQTMGSFRSPAGPRMGAGLWGRC